MIVALAFSHVAAYLADRFIAPVQTKGELRHGGRTVSPHSMWETLGHTHPRLNPTERTMRKTRNALLGILTMMPGTIAAAPTEAAERYTPGIYVYKAVPDRSFSYPYGGSYLRRAKRSFGNPYVNPYYG